MTSTVPQSAAVAAPPRSTAVTVVAWVFIALGAVVTPISFISLLMVLAGSHGTSSTDLLGFFKVAAV